MRGKAECSHSNDITDTLSQIKTIFILEFKPIFRRRPYGRALTGKQGPSP
jgi:hypothetical protein